MQNQTPQNIGKKHAKETELGALLEMDLEGFLAFTDNNPKLTGDFHEYASRLPNHRSYDQTL